MSAYPCTTPNKAFLYYTILYYTILHYTILYYTEIQLDSSTFVDSNVLSLKCYNLHRVDDPDSVKKEWFVFIKKKRQLFVFQKQSQTNVLSVKPLLKINRYVIQSPCIDHHHKLQINLIISFNYLRNCCKLFLNVRVPLF